MGIETGALLDLSRNADALGKPDLRHRLGIEIAVNREGALQTWVQIGH